MSACANSALSGYRMMWLYVMFDLPVGTKAERKAATRFRQSLLDDGFEMAQFSVYLRFAESKEKAEVHIKRNPRGVARQGKGPYRDDHRQAVWQRAHLRWKET